MMWPTQGFIMEKKVETKDGRINPANFEEPLDSSNLKSYEVCEESKAFEWEQGEDIFCGAWDRGTTAEEIVNNFYNQFITLPSTFRFNQIRPQYGVSDWSIF